MTVPIFKGLESEISGMPWFAGEGHPEPWGRLSVRLSASLSRTARPSASTRPPRTAQLRARPVSPPTFERRAAEPRKLRAVPEWLGPEKRDELLVYQQKGLPKRKRTPETWGARATQ